jgi:peptidoglycan/xylan/chitin deacetylase (PgdA/CDA1 family)
VVPLGWSIGSQHWKKPSANAIVANVLSAVHPGASILMHDAGGAAGTRPSPPAGHHQRTTVGGYTVAPLPRGWCGLIRPRHRPR